MKKYYNSKKDEARTLFIEMRNALIKEFGNHYQLGLPSFEYDEFIKEALKRGISENFAITTIQEMIKAGLFKESHKIYPIMTGEEQTQVEEIHKAKEEAKKEAEKIDIDKILKEQKEGAVK